MPCPACESANVGRSPTGDWCNDCGWAAPGYECERCGRQGVAEHHLTTKRTFCRTYKKGQQSTEATKLERQ